MNGTRPAPAMTAWVRLEAWLQALVRDKQRLARYFLVAYWISMAFVLLGAVIILLYYMGRWP